MAAESAPQQLGIVPGNFPRSARSPERCFWRVTARASGFAAHRLFSILSGWWPNRGGFGGSVHLLPEFVVTQTATGGQALVGGREDLLEFPGMGEQQLLDFVVVGDTDQNRDRPAIFGDHDRSGFRRLQVRAQMRFDVGHGGDFHSSTSSPAMNNRLRSLTPIARMNTFPLPGRHDRKRETG
jgi:hypothetical protein